MKRLLTKKFGNEKTDLRLIQAVTLICGWITFLKYTNQLTSLNITRHELLTSTMIGFIALLMVHVITLSLPKFMELEKKFFS